MKIEFNKTVKYKGVIYEPNNSFNIDDKDEAVLLSCGGIVIDDDTIKYKTKNSKIKVKKEGDKDDSNRDSEI